MIPKKVKILNPPKMFQVGKEYRLVCLAQGSRPPPEITWKIGRFNVKSKVISFDTNFKKAAMLFLIFLRLTIHKMN